MALTKELSAAISFLRFPLILGVVYVHYHPIAGNLPGARPDVAFGFWESFIKSLLAGNIIRPALPLFFLFSGLLFFKERTLTTGMYLGKLKKRFNTLFVPFVLYNLLVMALYLVGQSLAATRPFFARQEDYIAGYALTDFLAALFGIGRSPIAYQFWFIRDLMLLVLAAPVIHFVAKKAPVAGIVVALALFATSQDPDYSSVIAILYFYLGAMVSIRDIDVCAHLKGQYRVVAIHCVTILVIAYSSSVGIGISDFLYNASIFVGTLSALIVAIQARSFRLFDSSARLAQFSFFVFAFHEPLIQVVKKSFQRLLPMADGMVNTALFLALPLVVAAALVVVARRMKMLTPRAYAALTGER